MMWLKCAAGLQPPLRLACVPGQDRGQTWDRRPQSRGQAGAGARSLTAAKRSRSCAAPSGHLPEPSRDSLLILPNVCPLSVSTLEHAAPPPAGRLLQRTESSSCPRPKLQRRHLPSTFVWAGAPTRSGDEAHTVRPRGSPLTFSRLPLELVPNTNAAIHKNVQNCCWTTKSSVRDQTRCHALTTGDTGSAPSSHRGRQDGVLHA